MFLSLLSVILGVLLGVLLPRGESEEEPYKSLQELPENSTWYGNEEIRIFRQYLTIATVHPDINYGEMLLTYKLNTAYQTLYSVFQNLALDFLKNKRRV